MSSFAKLYASMENEEEAVDAVPEVTTDDVIEAQEVTEEVAEAEAEVEEVQEAIEEGVQDAETLETVADTLEETVEDGGADPATAQMAEVAVESIYRRLGIQAKAMPALEAFNDKEQRVTATKLAVEDIKEKAKKVWEAIYNFFKKLANGIVELFKKVVSFFMSNEKVIKGLITELNSLPASKKLKGGVLPKTIASFGNVKENNVDGFVDRVAKVKDIYKNMLSYAAALDQYFKIDTMEVEALSKLEDKTALDTFLPAKDVSSDIAQDIQSSFFNGIKNLNIKVIEYSIIGNTGLCFGEGMVDGKYVGKIVKYAYKDKFGDDKEVDVSKDKVLGALKASLDIIAAQKATNVGAVLKATENSIGTLRNKLEKDMGEKFDAGDFKNIVVSKFNVLNGLIVRGLKVSSDLVVASIGLAKQFKSQTEEKAEDKKEEKK